jgi:hypothetical protein
MSAHIRNPHRHTDQRYRRHDAELDDVPLAALGDPRPRI